MVDSFFNSRVGKFLTRLFSNQLKRNKVKVTTRFSHNGHVYEAGDEIAEGAISTSVLNTLSRKKMISGKVPAEESAEPTHEKVEATNITEKVEKKPTQEKAEKPATGNAVKNK